MCLCDWLLHKVNRQLRRLFAATGLDVGSENGNFDCLVDLPNFFHRRKAIHARHVDNHRDAVGLFRADQGNRFITASRFNYFPIWPQACDPASDHQPGDTAIVNNE